MPTELESKLRVDSHEPVREKLRAAAAAYVGRVKETNRILDTDDGRLLNSGCGLRIRRVEILDGNGPKATVTFKGPRVVGKFKQREEWETQLDDADAMTAILAALGFKDRILFEKRRETWRLGECTIELDDVAQLGLFVEVEGPSESAIDAVLALIGLDGDSPIHESYIALLMKGENIAQGETRSFRFG
ncbi:MAG: class IV adenylate cyclase [Planctomycetes bacterium]|nr:class IV adenylate cyclase [Planctomycetota bacterium]